MHFFTGTSNYAPLLRLYTQLFIHYAVFYRNVPLFCHYAPLLDYWSYITLQEFHYVIGIHDMSGFILHVSKFTSHRNSCYVMFLFPSKSILSLNSYNVQFCIKSEFM